MADRFLHCRCSLLSFYRWLLILSYLFCIIIELCHGSRIATTAGSEAKKPGTLTDEMKDFAVALDAATFNSTLSTAPALYAIVEFYANWCPACRNYKPHYEKVARLFNGPDAIHPGILFMAKVDCALKVNSMLCDHFKISRYPTLFWAPQMKSAWVAGASADWEMIGNAHRADLLLQAVNKKINKSYTLEDIRYFNEPLLLRGGELDLGQVAISIHDIEEATAKAMDIIVADKLLNEKTRPVFIQLLQLVVVHHPSRNCKKGSADLLMSLEDWWPSLPRQENEAGIGVKDIEGPDFKALERFHICGDHVPHDDWIFCRGSRKDTRGYSCGLWLLFHALSVRVEDRLAATAFQTICGFVGNFFKCKECSEHFLRFCSSAKLKVSSRRQLAIWLWDAHNKVNSRLQKEEASLGNADPVFLKQPWPPESLCKSCWKSEVIKGAENSTDQKSFSFAEVYHFLVKFYGHALSPSNSTGSIISVKKIVSDVPESAALTAASVPIGAALAVAFASCGFGAVACFWRSRQKKRKQVRRLA